MSKAYVDTLRVAVQAFQTVIVHAEGAPAQTIAVGVAAAAVFVGVFIGYGAYRAGCNILKD